MLSVAASAIVAAIKKPQLASSMIDTKYYNQEAADAAREKVSFSFGSNWQKFLAGFDNETLARAERSFIAFTKLARLDEHEFLDVGSGSGLSSLIAIRLGARKVFSIDIDPHSIDCALALRERFGIADSRWQIRAGSVLDAGFLQSVGRFSYVHSWGVLHHTGDMWRALGNLVEHNVRPEGHLHLAIYNRHRTSRRWLTIKRLCNQSPRLWFPAVKWLYVSALFGKMAIRGQSPITYVREYKSNRGMDFYRDIDDWIGGLPYEVASPGEMTDFLSDRGFALCRLQTTDSCGCNEFLYQRSADAAES